MKGDRKIPTNTFVASADQLEPTFFKICVFSNFRIGYDPFLFLTTSLGVCGDTDCEIQRLKAQFPPNTCGIAKAIP
jgi:hypothetical protein